MGQAMRWDWSFPKRGDVLINALEDRQAYLVGVISQNLNGEQILRLKIQEYRDRLQEVGIEGYEKAYPPTVSRGDVNQFRNQQTVWMQELDEVRLFIQNIRDDLKRDPHRSYKLAFKDLQWFGFYD